MLVAQISLKVSHMITSHLYICKILTAIGGGGENG